MQFRIHAPRMDLPGEARAAIERKLRLALGRHAPAIDQTRVSFGKARGTGNEDRSVCRIRVRWREGETIVIEGVAEDFEAAAHLAAWRLEHRLGSPRASRGAHALHRSRALQAGTGRMAT